MNLFSLTAMVFVVSLSTFLISPGRGEEEEKKFYCWHSVNAMGKCQNLAYMTVTAEECCAAGGSEAAFTPEGSIKANRLFFYRFMSNGAPCEPCGAKAKKDITATGEAEARMDDSPPPSLTIDTIEMDSSSAPVGPAIAGTGLACHTIHGNKIDNAMDKKSTWDREAVNPGKGKKGRGRRAWKRRQRRNKKKAHKNHNGDGKRKSTETVLTTIIPPLPLGTGGEVPQAWDHHI